MVSTRWLLVDPRQREIRRSLSEDRRKPPTRIQGPWDLCVRGPNCVLYFLRIAILETYVNHPIWDHVAWHHYTMILLFNGSWRLSRIRYLIGPKEFDLAYQNLWPRWIQSTPGKLFCLNNHLLWGQTLLPTLDMKTEKLSPWKTVLPGQT